MATRNAEDVLRVFIADIDAVGLDKVKEDWPDLVPTYKAARLVSKRMMSVTIEYDGEPASSFEEAARNVFMHLTNTKSVCNFKVEDEFGNGAYVDISGGGSVIQIESGCIPWGPDYESTGN